MSIRVAALAVAAASLLGSVSAQQQPAPSGGLTPANQRPPPAAGTPGYPNSTQQSQVPNVGAPLFGGPRTAVGPDPTPRIRHPYDCPVGYEPPMGKERLPHLTVCVVKQTRLTSLSNTIGPVQGTVNQQVSSMPPILERGTANQCTGRVIGSYACGRGGTECCGPNQDNMCFAGAYACYPSGTGTGPKTACCMSK